MSIMPPARVTVIGAGYLGLTYAVCLASLGHEVLAIDVDTQASGWTVRIPGRP